MANPTCQGWPQKWKIVKSPEKWWVPNSTLSVVYYIFHTHGRLSIYFSLSQAKPHQTLSKGWDEEFQKIYLEALHYYNQSLRLKEPLVLNEDSMENSKSLHHLQAFPTLRSAQEHPQNIQDHISILWHWWFLHTMFNLQQPYLKYPPLVPLGKWQTWRIRIRVWPPLLNLTSSTPP